MLHSNRLYIYLYLTFGSCPLKQRMKSIIVEVRRILTTGHCCLFDHQGTCSCHVICPKENKYFVTKNLPVVFIYPVVRIIMHTCLILGCSVIPVIAVSSHWYQSIHPSIHPSIHINHPDIHTSIHTFIILGDPEAVSLVRGKDATKVFKHGWKSPWVPSLNGPFPNG